MMKSRRIPGLLSLATVMLMAGSSQHVIAGQEEYKPKAKVTPLVEEALPGVDGRNVIIKQFDLPAGFVGGRHSHPGPVYVYVVDGELTVALDGGSSQTLTAGALYQEPIGRVMQARNLSTSATTKIVVFQIGEHGKPMMIKAQ